MIVPRIARRSLSVQHFSLRSQTTFSSLSHSLSSRIHRPGVGAALLRPHSQNRSHDESHKNIFAGNDLGFMGLIATSAAAGLSFLGASSSSSQALCESAAGSTKADDITTKDDNAEAEAQSEPEIDPYDNLPEEDEPTHCTICLTYRQGPCRPYWRKVEACTKDGEKEKDGNGTSGERNGKNKDDDNGDDSPSPMSDSTRCFKYMMPWIDCASKYRNLYTLVEFDTNYTEGIEELEATSLHFCWAPGQEPKIDWSGWQNYVSEDENEEAARATSSTDDDSTSGNSSNVVLWKTIDPAHGDPKLITIEAQVPTAINAGLGILECAYAVDQDNNVIGFAYGTKPSELLDQEKKEEDANNKNSEDIENKDNKKKEKGAESDDANEKEKEKGMVTLNVRLLPSRTQNIVLAASYTHRIENAKSGDGDGGKPIALESHLYKSKPFALASIPKLSNPAPAIQESGDEGASQQTSS